MSINPDAFGITDVFSFDRRCPCSTNHKPTELISYNRRNACYGACDTNNLCDGEALVDPAAFEQV